MLIDEKKWEDKKKTVLQNIEEAPWMVSFVDTLSLLLTFFVLLFSMSTLDRARWDPIQSSIERTFKEVVDTGNIGSPVDQAIPQLLRNRAINLNYLGRILQTQMERAGLQNEVKIQTFDDRMIVALPSDLLFDSGDAQVRAEARKPIMILGGILRNVSNRVEIAGHTDPNPLRNTRLYQDNWELSLARSLALSEVLKSTGFNRPLTVLGYADAKVADLPMNLPQSEKYALSRRVDIIIYPYVK